jgi:ribonuclease HII
MLDQRFNSDYDYELGMDEAGRGPLFGRLYVAGAILPKGNDFHHEWMKDSKRFHSKKKIKEMSNYIKEHAIAWSIQYVECDVIDHINIRESVHKGMHNVVKDIFETSTNIHKENTLLLIDGNHFKPYSYYDEIQEELRIVPHQTVEGGDNKYTHIAAASILAKVARDEYIKELCVEYPQLNERYGIEKNQGYGTKQHLEGILEHGISQWHRKSYGRCKESYLNAL